MDTEKLLKAFTPEETQELVAALPANVLTDEVVRRGIEIPVAVGATATHGAEVSQETGEEQAFRSQVGRFLDAETRLDVTEQLSVMGEFWGKLGHVVPELSEDQQAKLAKVAEAHPLHRVVPTPLLSLAERKAVAEKARSFPGQKFSTSDDALLTPDESWVYGKLLRNPESTVEEGRKSYGLRYKTEDGGLVSRSEYVAHLKENGQAVEAEDGTVWTFPVMDVRVHTKRTRDTAGNLHKLVDTIATPESLVATQLLHQANGTPNPQWEVDFANEAIYELTSKREATKKLVGVASIRWYPDRCRVCLSRWNADFQRGDFGVRGAESGL